MALLRPVARPVARMRVRLFGPLMVTRDETELDTTKWRRWVDTLFVLLLTSPNRRRPRDEVMAMLWPDADPHAAAGDLRYVLHLLRRSLGGGDPSPALSERGWLALNPLYDWDVDIERFEEALGRASEEALLAAAALRTGEPLLCGRYDEWTAPLRNRLQREWRDLCLEVGRRRRDAGDAGAAVVWLEHALDASPLDEEALEALLRALDGAGRRPEALRRYAEYARSLEAELATEPGPRLRAFHECLRAGPAHSADTAAVPEGAPFAPSYPLPTAGRLIGRRQEVEALTSAWALAPDGEARLLLIAGEAGIGKTCLLAEAAHHARARGAIVLAGGCYEQEGRLAYGPIHDALLDYLRAQPDPILLAQVGELRGEIARVVPELRTRLGGADETSTATAGERRLWLFAALAQLFERIAGKRQLYLLLDDLHWADRPTIQLLHYLARQPAPHGPRIIASYRDTELSADTPLMELLDDMALRGPALERVSHLALRPLDASETRALIEDHMAGDCAEALRAAVYRVTMGNPLFTLQLLTLLREEGRIERAQGQWRLTDASEVTLPPSVRETVARRLRGLGQAERDLLRAGAVLGASFAYDALAAMWSGNVEELCAALDVLLDARLLRETGEGYSFTQPVLREVVYQGTASHRRRLLHQRAFHALRHLYTEHERDHATELAWHCLQAGDGEYIVTYAALAGDQAASLYSMDEAERQYRVALAHLPTDARGSPTEAELLLKLGKTLRTTARTAEAAMSLERAAELYTRLGEPVVAALALVNLAKTYLRSAQPEKTRAALAGVEAMRGEIAARAPTVALVALYEELGNLSFRSGGYVEANEAFSRAVEAASALGDEALMVRTRISQVVARAMLGELMRAGEEIRGLIPRAEATGDREALRLALAQAAESAMLAGALGESKAFRLRELEVATAIGPLPMAPFTRSNLAQVSLYLGEWEAARRYAEESLAAFRACGNASRAAYPLAFLGEWALRVGDDEAAEGALDESVRVAREVGDMQALRYAARLLAERDIAAGSPERAVAALEPLLDRPGLRELDVAYLLPTLAWASLALDDTATARTRAACALGRAREQNNRLALHEALRVHALILASEKAWDDATAALNEALRITGAMPYPFAEARLWLAMAAIARGRGDSTQAVVAQRRATAILRRLGATRELAMVEAIAARGAVARS